MNLYNLTVDKKAKKVIVPPVNLIPIKNPWIMEAKIAKRVKQNLNLKKFFFTLFDITETTDRGRKWERVERGQVVKWN